MSEDKTKVACDGCGNMAEVHIYCDKCELDYTGNTEAMLSALYPEVAKQIAELQAKCDTLQADRDTLRSSLSKAHIDLIEKHSECDTYREALEDSSSLLSLIYTGQAGDAQIEQQLVENKQALAKGEGNG